MSAEHDYRHHADIWQAPCPDCKSKTKRCKRPSGHDATYWHKSREDAFARLNPDCPGCRAWLTLRAAELTLFD